MSRALPGRYGGSTSPRHGARILTRLPRLAAWIVCVAAAGVVVVGPSPPGPSAEPPAGDRATAEVLSRAGPVRVPPAPGRGGWTIHAAVLSAPEAATLGDGWVVLDTRSSRIHFLDRDLGLARSVGGDGRGPGELLRPWHLAVLGDSLVGVLDATGSRLDLFTAAGGHLGTLTPRVPGCLAGPARDLVADPRGAFVLQGVCPGSRPRWTAARVALDGSAGVVAAFSLSAGQTVAPAMGRAVVAWRGGLWTGRPDGCFSPIDPEGHGEEPVACLPERSPVPFPDSLRRALTGRDGQRVALPDELPPFVTASWSSAGPVLTLPDGGLDGTRAVLRDDGSLLVIESDDPVIPGRQGLLVTRAFGEGTGFRLVPWPAR